ncbi:MAG: hypothetical protein QGG36_17850 [Pirellulaceae bacterium]|jgi:hypothetical protein|nr:hypothetical protein [Pirellulaceae bacterium]MDP7017673.1 hypothetical protein [Pirellulaceae bacterium]
MARSLGCFNSNWILCATVAVAACSSVASAQSLAPGVRGVATRAPANVVIDGNLNEFKNAFCTPINYFHRDQKNRPAQFFYMWDDEAFYAGLRTLDQKRANHAPDDRLWEGDGVEWYFDTRRGAGFRSTKWTNDGSVHCYWVGLTKDKIEPRFCLRPGYLDAIPNVGVEVGARETDYGMEVEFKLPWKNFANFKVKAGEVIAVDAELCYADGGPRVDRYFAYGSPLSVQQPASLAKVALVDTLRDEHWAQCGPVMMPVRCDTAWSQRVKAHAHAQISLPPNHREQVRRVVFQLTDLQGKKLGEYEASERVINKAGGFAVASAHWPVDTAPPGGHHVTAIVYGRDGELTRIAPRLVSTAMKPGY